MSVVLIAVFSLWLIVLIAKVMDDKNQEQLDERNERLNRIEVLERELSALKSKESMWEYNAEFWKKRYNSLVLTKGLSNDQNN